MLKRHTQSHDLAADALGAGETLALERAAPHSAEASAQQGTVVGGPRHVAIIMDGNGRWAKARGLPRLEGHRRGARTVRRIVECCPEIGVESLTLYAFSTENWRRPVDEVSGLMDLFRRYLTRETVELRENGVRVRFIGDPAPLADDIRAMMRDVENSTAQGRRLTLSIAINYGSRAEIAEAARRLAASAAAGELNPSDIDENAFDKALEEASGAPAPDLLIRTGGDQRLSNFLLWQSAYSELMFVPEAWPEFTPELLRRAAESFAARERRFGGV